MYTAWLEQVMRRLVSQTALILDDDSERVFKTILRGKPLPQTLEQASKPAVFFHRIQERPPDKLQVADGTVHVLLVGAIIHGAETEFQELDPESILLEKLLEEKFEGNRLGGLAFPIRWRGWDTPFVNQVVPLGTTMPIFGVEYVYLRGKAFDESGGS